MKHPRYYFSFILARSASFFLKILGRNATCFPGVLALKFCPNFLELIAKPKKVIAITGTNGKTSISNLTEDILESFGEKFTCNKLGSNVASGIVSSLINDSTFFGKPKHELAVFEVDERSTPRIFKYIQPDIILVSNIFRDSYRRNAHIEYIVDILNENIPNKSTVIVNADDPVCSNLVPNNNRYYFSVAPQEFESGISNNIVKDGTVCPVCSSTLVYDFIRYHQVGVFHCDNCEYSSKKAEFIAKKIDLDNQKVLINIKDKEYDFKLIDKNLINVYNQISAISILSTMGYDAEKIKAEFEKLQITKTRLDSTSVNGKNIISFLSKGQNPIACSRAFDTAKDFEGKKCVIILLDDIYDAKYSVENIAYLFDTDFELLKHESINQILFQGARSADMYIRLLMAGINKEIIKQCDSIDELIAKVDLDVSDTFVIYRDIHLSALGQQIKTALAERIGGQDEN